MITAALRALVLGYRWLVRPLLPAACRFYPSCSEYAEMAIRDRGAVRGFALSVWRVLRCSPLSRGGVEYPGGKAPLYDGAIHGEAPTPIR